MSTFDEIKLIYEQTCESFRATWDLYIKFYTVFLTTNIAGLGLVVQYIPNHDSRAPIVYAFIIQNIFLACTSAGVGLYSADSTKKLKELLSFNNHLTPIPTKLALWGGFANSLACITFIFCWIFARNI